MKVYIVNNEYNTDCKSSSSIMGVYDSIEKAQDVISDLYHDDCDWLQEYVPEGEKFEEDTRKEQYTYIQYEHRWSKNWIEEFEVV